MADESKLVLAQKVNKDDSSEDNLKNEIVEEVLPVDIIGQEEILNLNDENKNTDWVCAEIDIIEAVCSKENFPQENNDENIDENHKNQTVQATNIMTDIVCQIEEDETTVHAKIDEDSENIIQTAIPDTVKKIDDVKTKSMKNGRPFYRRWRATSEGKPKTGKSNEASKDRIIDGSAGDVVMSRSAKRRKQRRMKEEIQRDLRAESIAASNALIFDRMAELAAGIASINAHLETIIRKQERLDAMLVARFGHFEHIPDPDDVLKQG